jgi:hypothetical protein
VSARELGSLIALVVLGTVVACAVMFTLFPDPVVVPVPQFPATPPAAVPGTSPTPSLGPWGDQPGIELDSP